MDPSVIRSATNPAVDSLQLDTNFEIADLPVKLELRYAIESKRAANGLECPKTEYKPVNKKEDVSNEAHDNVEHCCLIAHARTKCNHGRGLESSCEM